MSYDTSSAWSVNLRAGDWVEVRSKEEILKTLDKNGRLDQLPFMPHMFEYCGQRFKIDKSAHKTCDTINWTGGRRMSRAVHLQGIRCSGKEYGGCEAACLIFWKEPWLKRVDGPSGLVQLSKPHIGTAATEMDCTEQDVIAATRAGASGIESDPTYCCQATELVKATAPLKSSDVRQYVQDYVSGNASASRIIKGLIYSRYYRLVQKAHGPEGVPGQWLVSAYDRLRILWNGPPFPRKRGRVPSGQKTPTAALDLKPGDWVRVKSYDEILSTLDENNKNRGLYFDAEHVPYCEGRYRVLATVRQIIDEPSGKMIRFKSNSIILEGVCCQSRYSDKRMFCPRAIYRYWREIWLERVHGP